MQQGVDVEFLKEISARPPARTSNVTLYGTSAASQPRIFRSDLLDWKNV